MAYAFGASLWACYSPMCIGTMKYGQIGSEKKWICQEPERYFSLIIFVIIGVCIGVLLANYIAKTREKKRNLFTEENASGQPLVELNAIN